jgi:hypothetical protein
MKVAITGHTSGLGKEFYDHFLYQGYEVIGLSRSNGYDISKNIEDIIKVSSGCDLFINNAYSGNGQLKLLMSLKDRVNNIVVCGSSCRNHLDIINNEYSKNKYNLAEVCKLLSLKEGGPNILHLDITFIHNSEFDLDNINSNYEVTTKEIVNVVDFWLDNPKITQIQFSTKLTPHMCNKLKDSGANMSPLRDLKNKVDLLYEKHKV